MRVIDNGRRDFRARLTTSLAQTGLTQSEVARRVGVKRATVSAWVAGTRTPDLDTTRRLCAIFQWPIPEMLSWFGVYEPVQPNVDKARQQLDTAVFAGVQSPASGVTSPVTPPAQPTPDETDPQKELVVVPSPDHRALYAMLATFSVTELRPIAEIATEMFLRHFGGTKERKAEGE